MARSSGSDPEDVKNDWAAVGAHLRRHGRDPATLTFGATQFLHVVETGSRSDILDEQLERFVAVMGRDRTMEDLQASYLTGTVEEMQESVAGLRGAGLEYLILTPLVDDPRQLDLIARHIVAPFA